MEDDIIARQHRTISREDQRTFDRWLKANAVFGLILFAGFIVLALAGFFSK